jgi:hypothetical protein
VSKLPGFIDAQNANLLVMHANERFQIKFEQTQVIYGAHFPFDNL